MLGSSKKSTLPANLNLQPFSLKTSYTAFIAAIQLLQKTLKHTTGFPLISMAATQLSQRAHKHKSGPPWKA